MSRSGLQGRQDSRPISVLLLSDAVGEPESVALLHESEYKFRIIRGNGETTWNTSNRSTGATGVTTQSPLGTVAADVCLIESADGGDGLTLFVSATSNGLLAPTIVLSGNDHPDLRETAFELGVDFVTSAGMTSALLSRSLVVAVERRRSLEDVSQSYRFLQAALNAMPEALAVLDSDAKILAVNRSWQQAEPRVPLFGSTLEVGADFREHLESLADEHVCAQTIGTILSAALSGERPTPFEFSLDDQFHCLSVSKFSDPGDTRLLLSMRDITQRKRAQFAEKEWMRRGHEAKKLDGLVLLAGGIAHDFNNLLMVIDGSADLILNDPRTAEHIKEFAESITRASQRAVTLAEQLLAFAGQARTLDKYAAPNSEIQDVISALHLPQRLTAAVDFEFHDGIPAVNIDPAQLRQVALSLFTNACQAVESTPNPRIKLSTGLQQWGVSDHRNTLNTIVAPPVPGQYVSLEVEDNGPGMTTDIRNHAFDPFFSTWHSGRGLGLSAVMGVVRAYKGGLELETSPGDGLRIRVLFPAIAPHPDTVRPVTESLPHGKLSGTCLVVDDDPHVRKMVALMISRLGLTILRASNGREAIEIVKASGGEIDLILMDYGMPVLNGVGAFREIEALGAHPPVILMSGYAEGGEVSNLVDEGLVSFLHKPFTRADLERAVSTVVRNTSVQ